MVLPPAALEAHRVVTQVVPGFKCKPEESATQSIQNGERGVFVGIIRPKSMALHLLRRCGQQGLRHISRRRAPHTGYDLLVAPLCCATKMLISPAKSAPAMRPVATALHSRASAELRAPNIPPTPSLGAAGGVGAVHPRRGTVTQDNVYSARARIPL